MSAAVPPVAAAAASSPPVAAADAAAISALAAATVDLSRENRFYKRPPLQFLADVATCAEDYLGQLISPFLACVSIGSYS